MQSQIASDAIKTYKGDPSIMDKTKEWINYNFEAELDEQRKKYDAIIEKQAQDFDRRCEEQAQDFERRCEEQAQDFERRIKEKASELEKVNADFKILISGLLKKGFGIKEISEITNLPEERILELIRNK